MGVPGPLSVRLSLDARGEADRVGPYKVTGVLGRGGMGVVYEVVDEAGAIFALKIVELRFLDLPEVQAGRRFSQEIAVLSSLTHPSVVKMYAYGYARHPSGSEQAFFVMERLYGETLDQLIGREHVFKSEEAVRIIGLLAHALGYLEERGVIHRDIKPANLLIDSADRVVLMDFGLARSEELTRLTKAGQIIGTLSYMSPERLLGVPSTISADVFALGVVLYEMLTGELPFVAADPTELVQRILRGPAFPADFGTRPHAARLQALLHGMLAKSPGDRWSTTQVVERCLEIHPLTRGPVVAPTIEDLQHWPGTGTLTHPARSSPAKIAARSPSPPVREAATTAPIPVAVPALPPRPNAPSAGPGWPVAIGLAFFTFALGTLLGGIGGRRSLSPSPNEVVVVPSAPAGPAAAPVVIAQRTEPTFAAADEAFAYGDRAAKEGRAASAIRALERAIELNPVHAEAYRRLGDVLLSQGDEQGAFKRYRSFLNLQPDSPEAVELKKLLPP
jgi:serine/threonine protein kinase